MDQHQLPFHHARDFTLYRRDSPNLISLPSSSQKATSWIADYFLVATCSESEKVIVIHISPITGQFLHENKPGVDVFSSKTEAIKVLEKTFGCVKVSGRNGYYELCSMYSLSDESHHDGSSSSLSSTMMNNNDMIDDSNNNNASPASSFSSAQQQQQKRDKLKNLLASGGEFNYLLGACFVKNIPTSSSSSSSNPRQATSSSRASSPAASLPPKSSASEISYDEDYKRNNNNNEFETASQTSTSHNNSNPSKDSNNARSSSSSSVPMIEMYLIVANNSESSLSSDPTTEASKKKRMMAPNLARISDVRAIKVSSNSVGILCDPQIDYTLPATNHALNSREIESVYPTASELLTSLQNYSNHLCIHCKTNNNNNNNKNGSIPSFYSSSDFVQVDRDEEKYRKASAKAKETNTSLQAVIAAAEVSKCLIDTKARVVPWNYGFVVPLHRAQTSGFSRIQQSLAWLCVKVSLVFEFVNDLPRHQQQQQQASSNSGGGEQQLSSSISRIVSIPTFMFLKSSFITLPRWNQFSCGIEVASYCFSSSLSSSGETIEENDDVGGKKDSDDDVFFSAVWTCSRPASSPSSSAVLSPLHVATQHLPESCRKELFASLESEMKSKVQGRWSKDILMMSNNKKNEQQQQQSRNKKNKHHLLKKNLLLHSRDPLNDFAADLFVEKDKLSLKPAQSTIEVKTFPPQTTNQSNLMSKNAWSEFILSNILPQRGESNTSKSLQLKTLIVDFCSSVCKVRIAPEIVVGLSKIRPLSDPPVVNIKINKSPVSSSSLSSNSTLVTDILPNSKLRGVWYNNRILRNSVAVTFAVPFGCKIAGVGFLRPVFPRPAMMNSSSSPSIANPNVPYLPPMRSAGFSPYPISNRPELKYRAPFPSSAWTVSLGVSTSPHDKSPSVLLHDVSVPLVLYTETRPVAGATAAAKKSSSSSSSSGKPSTEHALCILRTPDLASVESRGFLTVPNEEVPFTRNHSNSNHQHHDHQHSSNNYNNPRATHIKKASSGNQDDWAIAHGLKDIVSTTTTPRCSFVTVVLRGSTNTEVPFGAHQIVLFAELPEPSSDVCFLDHQTNLKTVDPIATGKISLQKSSSMSLSFPSPQNLHDAFIAEEKRLALQLSASVWNSYNTIHNGNQFGKMNLNAHVCELLVCSETSKLIAMAGGNFHHSSALTNTPGNSNNQNNNNNSSLAPRLTASTTCCAPNCGKGGFFTRLTLCDNCGKVFCGNHWRKVKDVRLLERCSHVSTFNICNSCETLMNLLEAALIELEPKAMTTGTTISSNQSSHIEKVQNETDFNQKSKRHYQLTAFQHQRSQGSFENIFSPAGSTANHQQRDRGGRNNSSHNNNNNQQQVRLVTTHQEQSMVMLIPSSKPTISMTVKDIFFDRQSPSWIPVSKFDDEVNSSGTKLILDFVLPATTTASSMMSRKNNNNNNNTKSMMNLGLLIHTSIRPEIANIVSASLFHYEGQDGSNDNNKPSVTHYHLVSSSSATNSNDHQTSSPDDTNDSSSNNRGLNWIGLSPSRSFSTLSFEETNRMDDTLAGHGTKNNTSVDSSSSSLFQLNQFDLLRLTLDVTDAALFLRYINCIFVRQLFSASSSSSDAQEDYDYQTQKKLQTSRPQKRKATHSLFHDDDEEDDEDAGDDNKNDQDDDDIKSLSDSTSSSSSSSATSRAIISSIDQRHQHQYSTEVTADMSVRNMILFPANNLKTHCRIWLRPPTPVPQPGQQISSTHGVWGDAAGIVLRLPFGVSPNLHRSPNAHNHPSFPTSATTIHSFRTFVVERDISCRAKHVSTLSVPLVYLVSRSNNMHNAVEVFVPFGKSVKEENAAGFVLDAETVEKIDPSTGGKNAAWESDWASLADSASPFFVRDNKNLPSLAPMNNINNSNTQHGSKTRMTVSSSLTTNFKGSPVSTVNVPDMVKNSTF